MKSTYSRMQPSKRKFHSMKTDVNALAEETTSKFIQTILNQQLFNLPPAQAKATKLHIHSHFTLNTLSQHFVNHHPSTMLKLANRMPSNAAVFCRWRKDADRIMWGSTALIEEGSCKRIGSISYFI